MGISERRRHQGPTCRGQACFVCGLSAEIRLRLERHTFRLDYPARATLAYEGEPADRLIAVCTGSLRLLSHREDGRTQVLSVTHAGGLVGLHSALLARPLPFSVESREPTTAWVMPWRAVRAQLVDLPELWPRLALAAAVRHHETLTELKRSPFLRLVHLLLNATRRSVEVGIGMTEVEIGEAVGLSERSVRRHLARLRDRGLVTRRGNRLHVVDVAGLSRLAAA